MGTKTNITIGALLFTIMITALYVLLPGEVKLRVDDDKTTIYTLDESRWKVAGREYNKLFDGTSLMYRASARINVTYIYDDDSITIIRYTPYIRGSSIKDTYYFKGNISNVELVPIYHKIELFNASGYIYQYEVRELVYDGPTIKNVESPQSFGRNIKIEWDNEDYWNTVYKSGILKIRYRPSSDYEVLHIRMFDPVLVPTAIELCKEIIVPTPIIDKINVTKYRNDSCNSKIESCKIHFNGTNYKTISYIHDWDEYIIINKTRCDNTGEVEFESKVIGDKDKHCSVLGDNIVCHKCGNGGLCDMGVGYYCRIDGSLECSETDINTGVESVYDGLGNVEMVKK